MVSLEGVGTMMSVLQEIEEDEGCTNDETLQYLMLMLSKVALNTLVLSFWLQSISKSFMGIYALSMYLADLLMICFISWALWFMDNPETQKTMCSVLSHSSAMYSLLPFPAILGGTLDYATRRHKKVSCDTIGRTAGQCIAVLLMWVLACIYSYYFTNVELLTIEHKEGMRALVCPVHDATSIRLYNLNVFIVVGAILVLHCRQLPRWVRTAEKLSSRKDPPLLTSDLPFFSKTEKQEKGMTEDLDDYQRRPPLYASLTLCFAMNWMPYLVMSVAFDLLGFALPAYATVNLLWVASANSLLVGVFFYYGSQAFRPLRTLPDDICHWRIYWLVSKQDCQISAIL